MVILQACAFAAPAPGNFIPSLLGLERELQSRGIQTIYAFPERARDKAWCQALQQYTKVYFLPEARARISPETYRIFQKIYRENDVGIVHSHFELYDIPATVTAPRGIKVFWHLHDALKENFRKASSLHRILCRLQYGVFSRRAVMLSVSREHADFAKDLGFTAEKIHYLPNGINTDRIRVEELDAKSNRPEFLLFGWEVHRKGVDLLVEAAKQLCEPGLKVRVVGQEVCEQYLRESDVPGSVVFSRPVSDINVLYGQAAAFLHISRAEGLSYALLEALYAGLPVICSDIPENLFAKEFRNIIWIRNGNAEDLTGALSTMLQLNRQVRPEDVSFNRSLILREYSQDTWVSRVLAYYLGEA